jgi:uncharacterized protein (DUF3820 family)
MYGRSGNLPICCFTFYVFSQQSGVLCNTEVYTNNPFHIYHSFLDSDVPNKTTLFFHREGFSQNRIGCFRLVSCCDQRTQSTLPVNQSNMPSSKSTITTVRAADEVPHQVEPGILSVAVDSSVLGYDHTSTPSKLLNPQNHFSRLTTGDHPNLQSWTPTKAFEAAPQSQEQPAPFSSKSSLNLDSNSYFGIHEQTIQRRMANKESVPAASELPKKKAVGNDSYGSRSSDDRAESWKSHGWQDLSYEYSPCYDSEDWPLNNMQTIA